jgi:hypothetical protein
LSNQQNANELEINKGIELMLRREKPIPERSGININHKLTLLRRIFHFKLELSWEKKPQE